MGRDRQVKAHGKNNCKAGPEGQNNTQNEYYADGQTNGAQTDEPSDDTKACCIYAA